jgi:hypothetical protein
MKMRNRIVGGCFRVIGAGLVLCGGSFAMGQSARSGDGKPVAGQAPTRTAARPAQTPTIDQSAHPLQPAVDLARRAEQQLLKVRDYSCVMVKRERIDGKLATHESLFLKVRHEPFSVYLYCLGPTKPKGQEAIYVAGRNDNLVLAHSTGIKKLAGTLSLEPTSTRMMEGNLYPLTNIGLLNLTRRLITRETEEMAFGECEVKLFEGAKVDGRLCTCVEIIHPVPRKNFKFHRTRVFYDNEWQIPLRTENCGWPAQPGSEPPVMEEYTYQKLQLNRGFTDLDFDTRNPAYQY